MRITIIHPCVGRRPGQKYIRSWQMESLPAAKLAGLTPKSIDLRFYDDRMEDIPFEEKTDLVAISVETYTAQRAYQIASEYRRRSVPVVMGGFHATLCPDEVANFAEAVVTGDADATWPLLIDDFRHGKLEKFYHGDMSVALSDAPYDRSIFRGKRYLPIGLVETARGCARKCEFCAIQSFFSRTHRRRPFDHVLRELSELKSKRKIFFFVDDNFASDLQPAKDFLDAVAPLGIRWVTQMSIDAAHDEDYLMRLRRAGCQGVLIGFESLDPHTLRTMKKSFATMRGGYGPALDNLRRHGIRVYGTFIFGYDNDTPESFQNAVDFAQTNNFYIAAFNHLTPFPGTPLYKRLEDEGRLIYPKWWLSEDYSYNRLPFRPWGMTPENITRHCIEARRQFYSVPSILKRGVSRPNASNGFMWRHFFPINLMHLAEIKVRHKLPLGDPAWRHELVKAC